VIFIALVAAFVLHSGSLQDASFVIRESWMCIHIHHVAVHA